MSRHECGHLAQLLCALPLDEDDATEIGRRIVLPPSLCKALVRDRGFNAHHLARLSPDLPPAWALARVAEETGAVVIIEYARRRTVFGTASAVVPARRAAWEDRILRRAKETPARVAFGHLGVKAWWLGPPREPWSVVYAPAEALPMVEEVSRQVPGVFPFYEEPANDDG